MANVNFTELEELVRKLRRECPWDKIQTNDSIKAATLEEAYEVVESIDNKDYDELKKELGDLLLHVLFHSIIAEEENHFTISEVINLLHEKLIKRHPHIFGDLKLDDHEAVKSNWEKLKLKEGRESILDGLPKNLPELQKANRIQEKVAKVGFEWQSLEDSFKKVEEEILEMKNVLQSNNKELLEEEIGDLLFAITNFARQKNINSENALRKANKKFINRFNFIEKKAKMIKLDLNSKNLNHLLDLWNESKQQKF